MDDEMYDEFGNLIKPNLAEGVVDGDDIMDQDWLNEMNQLQLGKDSEEEQESNHENEAQDTLIAYQGKAFKGQGVVNGVMKVAQFDFGCLEWKEGA